MLIVTTPATSTLLMTEEQMRVATGLAPDDSSQDPALALLNARISAEIVDFAGIAIGNNGKEPTLRQETLTETFRCPSAGPLLLSRRHNVEIVSVTVDGEAVDTDAFEIEAESGLLHRVAAQHLASWRGSLISVVYKAGFETVPAALVAAASDLIRFRRSELARDPLVRSERIRVDGVDEVQTDYWVNAVTSGSGSISGASIPPSVAAGLSRFVNVTVA